jgi:hypothetical protein
VKPLLIHYVSFDFILSHRSIRCYVNKEIHDDVLDNSIINALNRGDVR